MNWETALLVVTFIALNAAIWFIGLALHEFGHWTVARLFGFWTPVFSIGHLEQSGYAFGPVFNTQWCVSLFPKGGGVMVIDGKIFNPDRREFREWVEKISETTAPADLKVKPRWQDNLVTAAGPAMEILIIAIAIMCGGFGSTTSIDSQMIINLIFFWGVVGLYMSLAGDGLKIIRSFLPRGSNAPEQEHTTSAATS